MIRPCDICGDVTTRETICADCEMHRDAARFRALYEALPKCGDCGERPATQIFRNDENHEFTLCERCSQEEVVYYEYLIGDLPYADVVRAIEKGEL